jgi:tRNA threonylcarbamoyl adenosine modification protein YeaZ
MSKNMILVIETLTKAGSLSLFSEQMDEIDCYIGNEGNKMSADLVNMFRDLINRNGIKPNQISKIIVLNGPGSFTGLRVGWAVVKGLAKGLSIPYCSVSSLDALFEQIIKEKKPDYTFVSVGGGKIALKGLEVNSVEVLSSADFLKELGILSNKSFVTLKDANNPLQNELLTFKNVFYASDNVNLLISQSFERGLSDKKTLNYFI